MVDPRTVICRAQDAQELGFCLRGLRKMWRVESKEITFEDFIRQGVSAQYLLDSGNPHAVQLAEHVLRKANEQQ